MTDVNITGLVEPFNPDLIYRIEPSMSALEFIALEQKLARMSVEGGKTTVVSGGLHG